MVRRNRGGVSVANTTVRSQEVSEDRQNRIRGYYNQHRIRMHGGYSNRDTWAVRPRSTKCEQCTNEKINDKYCYPHTLARRVYL